MKKILLISSIYPLPTKENKGTSVCHYFTKEWVKMGYEVQVVHVQAVYPYPFYWIAKLNEKRIAAKTGAVVYTKRSNKVENYKMDEVPVMRVPVFKPIPHGRFAKNSIQNAIKIIVDYCKSNEFEPDIIIGHFPNPQIEILSLLKKEYPLSKSCIVMHGDIEITKRVYGKRLPKLMKGIDVWGFRSKAVQESFERNFGMVNNPFICYSGIPERFITECNKHNFEHPLRTFVYVGLMIDRKYPEKVLDALNEVYGNQDYHINYIGEGQQLTVVKERIKRYGCQDNVSILGRIPREKIIGEYDKADCFVMISEGEAYGLVYLEAMARGCITIASRNEGIDGVIIDGENGFLCRAGDSSELVSIIRRINNMTVDERLKISDNAIATARCLTDEKVAKLYIEDVLKRL